MENLESYRSFKQVLNEFYKDELEKSDRNIAVENLDYNNIKIIPKLFYDKVYNTLNVEFKLGKDNFYKIKNLKEFYNRVINNESFIYSNKLEFVHNVENFDKNSQKILSFIIKYAKIINYVNNTENTNFRYYGKKLSESSILLDEEGLDELFEILKGRKIEIEKDANVKKVTLIPSNPNIEFYLNKNAKNELELTHNLENYNYIIIDGKKYTYIIMDEFIYRAKKNIKNTTFKLLEIYKKNYIDEIKFNTRQLPDFFALIEPKIKDNLVINIDKEEIKEYIPEELGIKIFLDYNESNYITAELKFCYGDTEFNPIDENKDLKIARNAIKETECLNQLRKTGFMLDGQNKRFILVSDEAIYNFLTEDIELYMQKFEVMVTDNFKSKKIKEPKIGNIGVKIENNLLVINLENINYDKNEIKEILQRYALKKKYYRLKDGSFIDLESNENIEFLNNLESGLGISYEDIENGTISLPIYRSMYMEKILNNLDKSKIKKEESYIDFIKDTSKEKENTTLTLPKSLKGDLREYQKNGFQWLQMLEKYELGGILADDMGLGKTIQVITLILKYKEEQKEKLPSIVIAPSSLTLNWKNEIQKFAPTLETIVINGSLEQRKKKIKDIKKYDLIITSYDLLKRDLELYEKENITFKYAIADEAQYIKNSNTQNAKALKSIKAETRYALTGTPIENSLAELWSIFDYIMPGYLFKYKKFKQLYEVPIVKDNDMYSMKKLKMLIEPFILRRTKKEVLTELPEKTITILNNEMEDEQQKIYLSYLAKAKQEAMQEIEINGVEKSHIKILALLTRLRQICCHPSLFLEDYNQDSSKLKQCIEIIKEGIEAGHKILLFSGYTSMFDIIEKELLKEDINYYKLTGKTNVNERVELVEDFNQNENVKVFLISLKAGGTGLNLTGADMVIHYDPWWNISAENQATDRAYRIGQKNNVQVYKLITKNSIEEKIYELQEKKSKLINNVLNTETTFINKLSKDEIMKLFE